MKTLALILVLCAQSAFAVTCALDATKTMATIYDERHGSDVLLIQGAKGEFTGFVEVGHDYYDYTATLKGNELTVTTDLFIDCLGNDKTVETVICY